METNQVIHNKWELANFDGTEYGLEEAEVMTKVLSEWAPTNNKKVREFERTFADYVGARYGIAANSWVGAAHLLAILMEFKKGDEVIVPAFTFQASANIFLREGATIVFADINARTFNIDVTKLEDLITPRTRAIVAVHMCGQPCDMDEINRIAKKHNIVVIQDAAHAPGALYKNKKLGELSDYAIYSFHQSKNMSTLGQGGMLVCNNEEVVQKMKRLRGHGTGMYIGISSRMTDMQGAVGLVQLKKLEKFNEIRRRLAYYMNSKLNSMEGIATPYEIEDIHHVYHIYNVLIDPGLLGIDRAELIKKLWTKKRVMVGTQYHPTVNCLPVYTRMGYGEGGCPVAESVSRNIISLPISSRFTEKDIDELTDSLCEVIEMIKREKNNIRVIDLCL